MALYDGFFDAVYDETEKTFDRTYDSSAFVDYFYQFIGNGVCVYNNPDSFRVYIQNGAIVVKPGYLFLQGYWMKNTADYTLAMPGSGQYAIIAHLNKGKRIFELLAQSTAQTYSDSLVLALVNVGAGTVTDTRYNADVCGVIDSAGSLASKVQFALNYIDTQVEAKLREAEGILRSKAQDLDNQLTALRALAESMTPPPIGSIKFSASGAPGDGWLRCNGSYISENDYPELVAALGNMSFGSLPIGWQLMHGGDAGDITNCVLMQDNCVAFYNHTERYLYISDRGNSNKSKIAVIAKPSANDFNNNSPIYLSAVNDDLFLVQKDGKNFTIWMIANPIGTVSPTAVTYSTRDYFSANNTNANIYNLDTKRAIPYVMKQGNYYYLLAGISHSAQGSVQYPNYLCLRFTSLQDVTFTTFSRDNTDGMYGTNAVVPQGFLGFSWKNKSECIYLSKYNSMTSGIAIKSLTQNLISFTAAYSKEASDGAPSFPISCLPIAGGDQIFYGMKIFSNYIVVESLRSGGTYSRIKVPLRLPSAASVFDDAVVYLEAKQIWLIFVGTGLIAAKNLDQPGDFGYTDMKMKMPITKNGHLESNANRIYVSGNRTNGIKEVIEYTLDEGFFKYSATGTWLPTLYQGNIPGYIKAREV